MKPRRINRVAVCLFAAAFIDAGTLGGAVAESPAQSGLSSFAMQNLAGFSTFSLSNGLQVIVKRNGANRVQHLSLVIRGGCAAASPATSGYEALALRTMARGSASYSYEDIQGLLDETSSGIGSGSGFDYSTYGLNTLDKYFDRLFPVWVDALVNPAFRQADFDQELSLARLALQSKEQDPWSKTSLAMSEILFAGHPYAVSPDGSLESLATARLEDIKAWYSARVNAASLFVVAVGDFDAVELRSRLETGLGKLPSTGAALPPPVPALRVPASSSVAKIEFPQSKGMGYLRGDFAAPPPGAPDFMALNLGMKLLSDLMFNVVRDKHGAAYSPAADLRSSNANYGSISLFKTKIPGPAKAYIDEAVALLASGRAVAIEGGESGDGYSPIAEVLDATKAQYINELFERQATNASIAGRIAASLVSTGDYRGYLYDADRIRAVTSAQLRAAVEKYVLGGKISWIALGSRDVLDPVRDEDFAEFAPLAAQR